MTTPIAKIRDVARAAGVSTATVSRVMNGTKPVSNDMAERVVRVAAELGYTPFRPAQVMRHQRTRLWAVVIPDIENPFFKSLVRGIDDVARDHGRQLLLCNTDEDRRREAESIKVLIGGRVAGVVIAMASARSSLRPLLDRGIPVVVVDRFPTAYADSLDSVVVDNRLGATLAVEHLIARGATRVACIAGPAGTSTASWGLEGYRDALERNGFDFDPNLVRRADVRQEGGYEATVDLLGMTRPPDALFVSSHLMTVGALQAIAALGVVVPDDLAIVGSHDAPWATLTSPPLTVLVQPAREIGREAARMLVSPASDSVPRRVVLPPTLTVRESSGAVRAIAS